MKKQSVYVRLQQQYKKLSSRIQKSIKNGRFYQFSQFKQEQLLGRLKRYSLQMKQLGMGVAACAALGMSTPAFGQGPVTQFDLVERTGTANPLNAADPYYQNQPVFVDIDGDGDQDLFLAKTTFSANTVNIISYYENTGTANVPTFIERTGANNPLDGIGSGKFTSFVDIDGDGDMDCFRGNLYNDSSKCSYYRNEGSFVNPIFVERPNLNPLDSVGIHLMVSGGTPTSGYFTPMTSFVDIDNDGDMDCFVGLYGYNGTPSDGIWYYENIGSATNPSFLSSKSSGTITNPLDGFNITNQRNFQAAVFKDTDKDGDMDALLLAGTLSTPPTMFYENQGSVGAPNFVLSINTPIDSALLSPNDPGLLALVDIDGDTDLDVFKAGNYNLNYVSFYENLDTTIVAITKIEEASFSIHPIPTTGLLHFEKNITGQANIYNELGQEVYAKELEGEQTLNLSKLENGLYFLTIKTEQEHIRKTILIEK